MKTIEKRKVMEHAREECQRIAGTPHDADIFFVDFMADTGAIDRIYFPSAAAAVEACRNMLMYAQYCEAWRTDTSVAPHMALGSEFRHACAECYNCGKQISPWRKPQFCAQCAAALKKYYYAIPYDNGMDIDENEEIFVINGKQHVGMRKA